MVLFCFFCRILCITPIYIMSISRFLLIIIVFIIFIHVMLRLLDRRQKILKMQAVVEGMTSTDEVAALQKAASKVSITNIIAGRSMLPLREYCIKASYSSAFSGTYVSAYMIKYVLHRGCRYLDIPVFYSATDNIPYVAHITDDKAIDSASDNKIPLDTVFNAIASNAFASSNSPNFGEPLFVELRIYPDKNSVVYDKVAALIQANFSSKRYADSTTGKAITIDGATYINDSNKNAPLMGSALFIMNKTINPQYASSSQDLANCINGEVGGSTFQLQTYDTLKGQTTNPPNIKNDFKSTNVIVYNTVLSDLATLYPHPDIINTVVNYGIQVTTYKFYARDDMLNRYEMLFDQYKSGFVPMAYAISYLSTMKTDVNAKKMAIGPFA